MWVIQLCPTLCDPMDCSPPGSCGLYPGKNTVVGCHFLLQGIVLTQGSNPGLLHCRQILYHLSHQGKCILNTKTIPNWYPPPFCFLKSIKKQDGMIDRRGMERSSIAKCWWNLGSEYMSVYYKILSTLLNILNFPIKISSHILTFSLSKTNSWFHLSLKPLFPSPSQFQ